jgi:hypothetical protein
LQKPILVIGNSNGALAEIVKTNAFGTFFSSADIDGIKQFLHTMIRQKQRDGFLRAEYPNMNKFDISRVSERFSKKLAELGL